MLRLTYFIGNYYPEGGSKAFADDLARCFEQRGGHILTSTLARRIVVEEGEARGVELEILRGHVLPQWRGGVVKSRVVVSNAGLLLTPERLVSSPQPRAEAV